MYICVAMLLCLPFGLFAQGLTLEMPTVGFIYNPAARSLHPIAGLAGAATIAAPVLSDVLSASVGLDSDTAIVANADGVFAVTGLCTASPQLYPIALSANSFLVAWGKTTAVIQTDGAFSLLAKSAGAVTVTPLTVGLPSGNVTSIDYDESARAIYLSLATNDESGGAYAFSLATGTLRQLVPMANPASIAHSKAQVFVLDGATSEIWTANEGTQPMKLPITTESDSKFVGIAVSADSSRIYAADAGGRQVSMYNLAGALIGQISANSVPTKLDRIANTPLFLISNEPGQPLWLLNDNPAPGIFFVPAFPVVSNN